MGLHVILEKSVPQSQSPYRLMNDLSPVDWANGFLDAQKIRGLSLNSLRTYAYDLLNLALWFSSASVQTSDLNEAMLLDYIRFQMSHRPQPSAQTINHRICVTHCLYRFHLGHDIPSNAGMSFSRSSPFAPGHTRRMFQRIRVKAPRKLVVPLSASEVSRFWNSFRTFRDLSLVALMLFNGLRSRETLLLKLENLHLSKCEMLITGKGNRQRILPLDSQTIRVIESYLRIERPQTSSPFLFLSLKGHSRGSALTPAGLRSLFRNHRLVSTVLKANPHRFRHTFGADMVKAGISLPALMHLMGHSQIHTTMLYVQLSPEDVWREFYRATKGCGHLGLPDGL